MMSLRRAILRCWQKGFTIFELILVLLIAGLIATQAIRVFEDLSQEVKRAEELGTVLRVRTGIEGFFIDPARGNKKAYPSALDHASLGSCSIGNPCFDGVLSSGGQTTGWRKLEEKIYSSESSLTNQWRYYSETGAFVKTED